jgi:adenylate cyclase
LDRVPTQRGQWSLALLHIHVVNAEQNEEFAHAAGAFEFGRGSPRDVKRFVVRDERVSRDHLRIEEIPGERLRATNLSRSQSIALVDGSTIEVGASREFVLPVRLPIGGTMVEVSAGSDVVLAPAAEKTVSDTAFDKNLFLTVTEPVRKAAAARPIIRPVMKALGESPAPEQLTAWLEAIIGLQRAPGGSKEFYQDTARAVVDLVDLELGMVILSRNNKWEIVGYYAANDKVNSRYSRTLLNHVVKERRTFYQDADSMKVESQSLMNVEAVVVSPIFGLSDEVVGVLYGSRTWGGMGRGNIRPLEAQVVQLLAAGVSENLARTAATKTRAQFEQFFSTALVRELERDPSLLEGRNQEVTILVSDLRGFTSMSERLAPETTCRVVRDVMEKLSDQIMAQGGVIVDYAGDGILAMWNAPVIQDDHVLRGAKAALAMQAEMPGLNAKWRETTGGDLAIGIGINTGMAQVGNTGSSRKLKYGPHGMTVNMTSRLQDATKKVGSPILVSESVRAKLPPIFTTRRVGAMQLAGITEPVQLFELLNDTATILPSELAAARAT